MHKDVATLTCISLADWRTDAITFAMTCWNMYTFLFSLESILSARGRAFRHWVRPHSRRLFPCELKNWIRGGLRHLEFVYTRKTRVYAHKMAFADSASPKHSATARRGASAHEWRGATANTNTDEEPSSPSVINGSASAELLPRPAPAEAHEELSGFGLRCRLVIFFRADASATFENTSYSNNQNSCDRYVYHTNARRQIQLEKSVL